MQIVENKIPQEFVNLKQFIPNIIVEPRYATPLNFMGSIFDGYKRQIAIASIQVALAIKRVHQYLNTQNYDLVVYDCYRPEKAVQHYHRWINDDSDMKTNQTHYPLLKKTDLIPLGYLGQRCPHSRACAIDVTIIKKGKVFKTYKQVQQKEIKLVNGRSIIFQDDNTEFMGTHFDFFDESSHHDSTLVNEQANQNRQILRQAMKKCNFIEYENEWWHYQIDPEPYPKHYFDFDIQ